MPYKDKLTQKAQKARYYRENAERFKVDSARRRAFQSPEHRRKINAIWLAAHPEARQKRRDRALAVSAERRDYVNACKSRACLDCGIRYPPYVMQFDHVRGRKVKAVATLARDSVSIDRLSAEMAKCDVVCANCHAERTHRRQLARKMQESQVNPETSTDTQE